MDGNVAGNLAARHHELEATLAGLGHLVRRAHDEDSRLRQLAAQLRSLGDGDHAESRRPRAERRPRDVDGAVAAAVRLHHGPQLAPGERVEEPARVVADRAEVDRDLAAVYV